MAPMMLLVTVTFIPAIRLLCINEAGLTTDDHYLENNLYGGIEERDFVELDCAVECLSHSDCLSFGFEPTLYLCHLHKKDSNSAPMDLVEKPGWKHSDISQWPKELMGPCADLTCPPGRRCSVHRVTQAAMCMEVGVYVCSEADVPNATCTYESKLIGGTRSCTCHSDYLDVPRDVLSVNNTCMKNGSWSKPSIHCSDTTLQKDYESKLIGVTRSCTCQSDYLDVPQDVLSVNNTCMQNGSWSTPPINCCGDYVKVYSPVLKTYTFQQIPASSFRKVTGGTSSLVFLVKTCHDANIALHTHPNKTDTDAYEIVVGGYANSKSFIRRCRACAQMATCYESFILSCNEYRPFWLSWKKDVISIGKGQTVGHQTFMEWVPSSPIVINHFSVSAYIGNHALWLFREQ